MNKTIAWPSAILAWLLILLLTTSRPAEAGFQGGPGYVGNAFNDASLSNTPQAIKASGGAIYAYTARNPDPTNSAAFEVFGVPSGSVTLGTTVPIFHITLGPGQTANLAFPASVGGGSTGLSCVAVSAYNGTLAPTTAIDVWVGYN